MSDCPALLTCPVCDGRLAHAGASLRCAAGHSFDIAREGHVDLLPTGHGRSGKEGDAAEMVHARRRFLGRGHYGPLRERIEAVAAATLRDDPAGRGRDPAPDGIPRFTVLEVGCGEGTYIGGVARRLEVDAGATVERAAGAAPGEGGAAAGAAADAGDATTSAGCCFVGVDISRPALRLAARAHGGIRFIRNDIAHRICLADGSVDLLLDVFAPRNPAEFARVMRPRGVLLVVLPAPSHLRELRAELPLLSIDPDKRERVTEQLTDSFELKAVEEVERPLELGPDDIVDLVRMTPSYWHVDRPTLERAASLGPLRVTAAFRLLRFGRRRPA